MGTTSSFITVHLPFCGLTAKYANQITTGIGFVFNRAIMVFLVSTLLFTVLNMRALLNCFQSHVQNDGIGNVAAQFN